MYYERTKIGFSLTKRETGRQTVRGRDRQTVLERDRDREKETGKKDDSDRHVDRDTQR